MIYTLYYLYIDESGDYNDYLNPFGYIIPNRSRFFTLGGIIVDEHSKYNFEAHHGYLINKYFDGFSLGDNFKIHYHELRYNRFPYNHIMPNAKILADEIFHQIGTGDCILLSVTIHKENHCTRYNRPVNVLGYALCLLLERFQHFLNDLHDEGIVIYEQFSSKMKKLVASIHRNLKEIAAFPQPVNIDILLKELVNGDPTREPLLQYADFFAYAPWIRSESNYQRDLRYQEIKHKYRNLDDLIYFKRGNVVI